MSRSNSKDFGIINPARSEDRDINVPDDVSVQDDGQGNFYVVDERIPNPESYRYYEGLPIDLGDNAIANNVLSVSQSGSLQISSQGLEVSESLGSGSLGWIDSQLPNVPGTDGGECRAIYGTAGEVKVSSTFTNEDSSGEVTSGVFYLSSSSSWPSRLWETKNGQPSLNDILVENEDSGVTISVRTTGDPQQEYLPPGTSVRVFLLPVTIVSGSAFGNNTQIISKYKAIALYETSLIKKDARLIAQIIGVGTNVFPIRFFIRMREGAQIGGLTIGQVTPNGIIQTPFTPHGCTLSVNNIEGEKDVHDGGVGDEVNSATKALIAFSEPDTLTTANYSFYDVRQGGTGVDLSKKCPGFISRDLLSGAGFSGVGDYPIRWLKFKESGDALASYFISANSPTEIDLSTVFGINTESVGPSFWGNKALFMIARSLEEGSPAGTMSVTLNYKEQ
jgi:hypothetical protein